MLPQRKNFSCLEARRLPVPKYNFANASRTHLRSNGELGKRYSSRQKSFQKVSQSTACALKFSKRTLIVRKLDFSALFFTRSRSQVGTSRDDNPQTSKYVGDSYIDEDYVTNMTFFACLHACRCTSRWRIKLDSSPHSVKSH